MGVERASHRETAFREVFYRLGLSGHLVEGDPAVVLPGGAARILASGLAARDGAQLVVTGSLNADLTLRPVVGDGEGPVSGRLDGEDEIRVRLRPKPVGSAFSLFDCEQVLARREVGCPRAEVEVADDDQRFNRHCFACCGCRLRRCGRRRGAFGLLLASGAAGK